MVGYPGRDMFGERAVDISMTEDRMLHSHVSSTIQGCLNEHCGLRAKEFALLTLRHDGKVETVLSQGLKAWKAQVFSPALLRELEHGGANLVRDGFISPAQPFDGFLGYQDPENERGAPRRESSSTDSSIGRLGMRARPVGFGAEDSYAARAQARKRHRGSDEVPIKGQRKRPLRIGEDAAVYAFYDQRFRDMQQAACKVIAKAFVKQIEPKKQTHHPYTGGAAKAPKWWPKDKVKHKEPDHLLKGERIYLLVHILRLVMNPSRAAEQKNVNIRKLEEVTMEAMSNWFTDPEHPANAQKRPYLKEIFQVAVQEERFMNGEIDGDTTVPVMQGDSRSGIELSDDEGDEGFKYDETHDMPHAVASISQGMGTPESLVSPTNMANRAMDASGTSYGFARDLPVRAFPPPTVQTSIDEHASYSDANSMQMGGHGVYAMRQRGGYEPHVQQASGLVQDTTRRPAWQHTSPGYPSPISTTSNSVFHNTWQQPSGNLLQGTQTSYGPFSPAPVSTAASTATYLPPPNASMNPLPPINQHQQHFENMVSRSYEPNSSLVRSGSIGQASHGYPDYLQGYAGPESDVKEAHMGAN